MGEIAKMSFLSRFKPANVTNDVEVVRGREAMDILDRVLFPVYCPRDMYDVVQPPEKIYYKVVHKRGDGYAVLMIYYWPDQVFPPHKYDYEPVVVILDKNKEVKEIYTDGFHYFVHRIKPPRIAKYRPYILIDEPWRSMDVRYAPPGKDLVMLYPVDEVKHEPAPTQLQYLSNKVVEQLRSRRVNPLAVNQKIIDNPFTVEKAKHWETYHDPSLEDLLHDFAKNYGVRSIHDLLGRLQAVIRTLVDRFKATLAYISEEILGEKREEQLVNA